MRVVASIALVLAGCGASPPAPTSTSQNTAARESGSEHGESDYCASSSGGCVPCDQAAPGAERCAVVFGALGSERPTPAPSPPAAEMAPLPAARRDAVVTANLPALAAPQAAFGRLLAMSLVPDPSTHPPDSGLTQLTQRIRQSADAVQEVRAGCDAAIRADPSLAVACGTLLSDALDLLASRIATLRFPMPRELDPATVETDPAAQAELQRRFDEGLASVVSRQAHDVFCSAAAGYQSVIARDPTATRATQQLALYGGAFLASCP